MVTLYTFVVNLRTAGLNGFFSFPGPAVDDLACELLVLAQLLGVLVQVHHRLADPGLLQPAITPWCLFPIKHIGCRLSPNLIFVTK